MVLIPGESTSDRHRRLRAEAKAKGGLTPGGIAAFERKAKKQAQTEFKKRNISDLNETQRKALLSELILQVQNNLVDAELQKIAKRQGISFSSVKARTEELREAKLAQDKVKLDTARAKAIEAKRIADENELIKKLEKARKGEKVRFKSELEFRRAVLAEQQMGESSSLVKGKQTIFGTSTEEVIEKEIGVGVTRKQLLNVAFKDITKVQPTFKSPSPQAIERIRVAGINKELQRLEEQKKQPLLTLDAKRAITERQKELEKQIQSRRDDKAFSALRPNVRLQDLDTIAKKVEFTFQTGIIQSRLEGERDESRRVARKGFSVDAIVVGLTDAPKAIQKEAKEIAKNARQSLTPENIGKGIESEVKDIVITIKEAAEATSETFYPKKGQEGVTVRSLAEQTKRGDPTLRDFLRLKRTEQLKEKATPLAQFAAIGVGFSLLPTVVGGAAIVGQSVLSLGAKDPIQFGRSTVFLAVPAIISARRAMFKSIVKKAESQKVGEFFIESAKGQDILLPKVVSAKKIIKTPQFETTTEGITVQRTFLEETVPTDIANIFGKDVKGVKIGGLEIIETSVTKFGVKFKVRTTVQPSKPTTVEIIRKGKTIEKFALPESQSKLLFKESVEVSSIRKEANLLKDPTLSKTKEANLLKDPTLSKTLAKVAKQEQGFNAQIREILGPTTLKEAKASAFAEKEFIVRKQESLPIETKKFKIKSDIVQTTQIQRVGQVTTPQLDVLLKEVTFIQKGGVPSGFDITRTVPKVKFVEGKPTKKIELVEFSDGGILFKTPPLIETLQRSDVSTIQRITIEKQPGFFLDLFRKTKESFFTGLKKGKDKLKSQFDDINVLFEELRINAIKDQAVKEFFTKQKTKLELEKAKEISIVRERPQAIKPVQVQSLTSDLKLSGKIKSATKTFTDVDLGLISDQPQQIRPITDVDLDLGLISDQPQQIRPITDVGSVILGKQQQAQRQKVFEAQRIKPIQQQDIKQASKGRFGEINIFKAGVGFSSPLKQIDAQRLKARQSVFESVDIDLIARQYKLSLPFLDTFADTGRTTITEHETIVPPVQLFLTFPSKGIPLKDTKPHDALVKEKGKFVRVNEHPLTKNNAKSLGAFFADNTSAARFKVRESKLKGKVSQNVDPYFNLHRNKFRDFEKKGKAKLKLKDEYIEKNTFRIDSIGEINQITVKGLKARRNKGFF